MAKEKNPNQKESTRPAHRTFRAGRSVKPRSGYGKAWDFHQAQALRLARASTYINRETAHVADAPPTAQEVSQS